MFLDGLSKELMTGKGALAVICSGILVGLLVIGLWPLDFSPPNEVWWLKDTNGLYFHGREVGSRFSTGGVAFSPDPLGSPWQSLPRKGALSIEIWLRPALEATESGASIVVFCDDLRTETLFVDQWKSHLIVFWQVSGHFGQKEYRKIGVGDALIAGKTRFVTITSAENGTSIYLEGKLAKCFPEIRLLVEDESVSGRTILLGNSPDARRSWSGEVFGLAVYDRSLTDAQVFQNFQGWTESSRLPLPIQDGLIALYPFCERSGTWVHSLLGASNPLLIPSCLKFEKRILGPPEISRKTIASFIQDVTINVVGFIPFGFFLSFLLIKARQWAPVHAYVVAIVMGVFVSLTIELLQVYLPARDSSQTDLICNTLGTILGVIVFHAWAWRLAGPKGRERRA